MRISTGGVLFDKCGVNRLHGGMQGFHLGNELVERFSDYLGELAEGVKNVVGVLFGDGGDDLTVVFGHGFPLGARWVSFCQCSSRQ